MPSALERMRSHQRNKRTRRAWDTRLVETFTVGKP
jgi:hypothetical protein